MPNYDAPAELWRAWMTTPMFGHPVKAGPQQIDRGKFSDFVKKVAIKRVPDAHLYSITTTLEAGFQRTTFHYADIVEVYNRSDFPR
jgi:hypothetical protein